MASQATASDQTEAPEEVRFIAMRRLLVGVDTDGTKIYREHGEPIPEAETWQPMIRARYLQEGHINQVNVVSRGRGRPKGKAES